MKTTSQQSWQARVQNEQRQPNPAEHGQGRGRQWSRVGEVAFGEVAAGARREFALLSPKTSKCRVQLGAWLERIDHGDKAAMAGASSGVPAFESPPKVFAVKSICVGSVSALQLFPSRCCRVALSSSLSDFTRACPRPIASRLYLSVGGPSVAV